MQPFFNDNEFEEFLKDQVNRHRMYPSDSVWRNIFNKIHGGTSWPGLMWGTFIVVSCLVAGTLFFNQKKTGEPVKEEKIASQITVKEKYFGIRSHLQSLLFRNSDSKQIDRIIHAKEKEADSINNLLNNPIEEDLEMNTSGIIPSFFSPSGLLEDSIIDVSFLSFSQIEMEKPANKSPYSFSNRFIMQPADSNYMIGRHISGLTGSVPEPPINTAGKFASVQVSLKAEKAKEMRWSMQVYASPLFTNYSQEINIGQTDGTAGRTGGLSSSTVVSSGDKPQLRSTWGLETGFAMGYKINRRFSIRSGVQLNLRQFDIYTNEFMDERTDANKLSSRSYELSTPVALDFQLLSKPGWGWNISTSLQPSYLLSSGMAGSSLPWKNVEDNFRKWNLHSNLETYIIYKSGGLNFQIGPQVRFQQPAFGNNFSVRDVILDYGIKVGISSDVR